MGDSSAEKARTDPGADRLDSWKEIASYLNRDVTTVQRWEKRERMPVHRHVHDRIGSVYASKAELDAWIRSRKFPGTPEIDSDVHSLLAVDSVPATAPLPVVTRSRTRWSLAALAVVLAAIAILWLPRTEFFWKSPLANARFTSLTDFDGAAEAAAISRDGQFVAFLSDREGPMDVWLTQVGTGQFHNVTRGTAPELVNPFVRTLAFSPDGSLITYWTRKQSDTRSGEISIWAVPILGGQPKLYMKGTAEFEWSDDGSRLVFHTPGPGDPLYVTDGTLHVPDKPIFTAPAGLHSHFPLFSPDRRFIYFVQGMPPDKWDIWRVPSSGGTAERITSQNSRVSYPVFLNPRTLLYLTTDPDGSGPWLYSIDVEHRIPHRLSPGPDRYTSLAASLDGRRLVVTQASPKSTLWKLPILGSAPDSAAPAPIPLATNAGSAPRLGTNFLLYVSRVGKGESIWKLSQGSSTQLWTGVDARVFGGPAIAPDGRIAFSVQQHGKTLLYVMQPDGTNVRVLADSLELTGAPAWSPDSKSILTAVNQRGVPHLFRVPLDGSAPTPFVSDYSVSPAYSPDGQLVIYSGADIGTQFSLKAANRDGTPHPLPPLMLSRGARRVAFLPGKRALVLLRGEIEHKNLWLIDLDSGAEKQLTKLPPEFDIRDFDISPDGREVVLERVRDHSDILLIDLPRSYPF